MSKFVIETQGLTRFYGTRQVVAPLDLAVPRDEIWGFLGRNGAGKSTTIRMLMGLVEPTRGSARVLGEDCRQLSPEVRARIGYLAEGHHVYGWMDVGECGRFQRAFYPRWNQQIFEGVVRHFGLEAKMQAKNLSRGQRAGLCLALALAPEPELLVLDDPALGLDPVARRSLLQSMIYVTRRADRTILFSSHLLADVERVADHIVVMDGGVLRASCPMETFRQSVRQFVLSFAGTPPQLPPIAGLLQAMRAPGEISLTLVHYNEDTARLLHSLGALRIEEVEMSMEDAFVAYLSERGEKSFFLEEVAA